MAKCLRQRLLTTKLQSMTNSNKNQPTGKPRKRRLQFGLRFLLIVFTLAIVGVASWRSLVYPWLERDAVRSRIRELGGGYTSHTGPDWIAWLLGENRCQVVTEVRFPMPEVLGANHDESFFRSLGKLTELEILEVPGRNITDETLSAWRGLTKLKSLNLTSTLVEDPASWPDWPLQELSMGATRLEDADYASLLKYEELTSLSANNGLGDGAVESLAGLPELKEMYFYFSRVTPDSWEVLASYPALDPKLQVLWFLPNPSATGHLFPMNKEGNPDLSLSTLPPAEEFATASRLAIRERQNNFDAMPIVSSIRPSCDYGFFGIETLYIDSLGVRPDAKVVKINSPYMDDEHFACMKNFPNLEALALEGSWVTDDGLAELANCRKLRSLSLRDSRISDQGLAQLLAACPQLESLSLAGTHVTEHGLPQLAKFSELQLLIIPVGAFRGAELQELKHAPKLEHLWVAEPGRWDKHSRLAPPWTAADIRAIQSLEKHFGPVEPHYPNDSSMDIDEFVYSEKVGYSQDYFEWMTFTAEAREMLTDEQWRAVRDARRRVRNW